MKITQIKRDLERLGIVFENRKRHWKLTNPKNGKWTLLLRHPSKEAANFYLTEIKKVLGL